MEFYSPLRYPGGKGRLSSLIKQIIDENEICDATYVEPYAGGAGVGLSLLMEEYVWDIVINDIDPAIYAFWHSILNNTEWFLKKMHDTPVDMDNWREQKEIFEKQDKRSMKRLGFAAFFLNRTNRSGILKGGVIGGKDQAAEYKIDARFNKPNLAERIKKIARKKSRIKLFRLDAKELLETIHFEIDGNLLFYFDPPYYKKGGYLYTNHYSHKDHVEIAQTIKKLNHPWIVTYDNVPQISKLYSDIPHIEFSLTYSAHTERPIGDELLFYQGLKLPHEISKMNSPHLSRYRISDLNPNTI